MSTPQFDNSYLRLPERFYARVQPEPVPEPRVLRVNEPLAVELGFDPEWLRSEEGSRFAVGNTVVKGSQPIATAYAGHQFGNRVPQLGDGRAHLLGEVVTDDGERFDVQLKGSGRTPYSRRGDGRSPLGPVLREYIVSEAMHALGVPTTRSLVASATGASVRRQTELPGGVLVRVARSHIRVGTFEFFANQGDQDGVRTLFDHVRHRHYPGTESSLELLTAVAERQASLVAKWMLVGFIHGVMNTDNMLLSGETIDYGPCAFMNEYDPETVYSSIDRYGRYAYGNQPAIGQWNLVRLAESLLMAEEEPDVETAQAIIDAFPERFREHYRAGMARKLGWAEMTDQSWSLVEELLGLMAESGADYTLTFSALTERMTGHARTPNGWEIGGEFDDWIETWRSLTDDNSAELMMTANPVVIPRNHRVETALEAAAFNDDLGPFNELVDVLATPFEMPDDERYLDPPRPEERVEATFCGT